MFFSPTSIKGRLFFWSFFCNTLVLLFISLIIYNQIKISVFRSVNDLLRSKAEVISNMLENDKKEINLELAEFVSGEYTVPGSGHYYKVNINGQKIIASKSLNTGNSNVLMISLESEKPGEKIFSGIGPKGEKIRVLEKNIIFSGVPVKILAAETIEDSLDIIENSGKIIFTVFPLAILVIGLITYLIARKSLSPLEGFSQEVSLITHKNLDKRINLVNIPDELQELTNSFNNMLDRLKKAFDTEKFIISEASHKLKTPITVIKGYCDVILQREREKNDYIKTLQAIRKVTENISGLISGILSLTNLDSGHLSFQSFREISLKSCILNAVEISRYLANQKNLVLDLNIPGDILINGDEDKLTEALSNIIENAVKYNRANGEIRITLLENPGKAVVTVSDTGIGIDETETAKIFERFYRSEKVKNIEGSGLGLNIARLIIAAHNGTISVDSRLGQGTEFNIIFKK
jgi:signal transduction histidine kinase